MVPPLLTYTADPTRTTSLRREHLLRISTSVGEKKSKQLNLFLWQILSCSLIGLLIIALRNLQKFSDRSFVSAYKPISILKLE